MDLSSIFIADLENLGSADIKRGLKRYTDRIDRFKAFCIDLQRLETKNLKSLGFLDQSVIDGLQDCISYIGLIDQIMCANLESFINQQSGKSDARDILVLYIVTSILRHNKGNFQATEAGVNDLLLLEYTKWWQKEDSIFEHRLKILDGLVSEFQIDEEISKTILLAGIEVSESKSLKEGNEEES